MSADNPFEDLDFDDKNPFDDEDFNSKPSESSKKKLYSKLDNSKSEIAREWDFLAEKRKELASLQILISEESMKLDERRTFLEKERLHAKAQLQEERRRFRDMWAEENKALEKMRLEEEEQLKLAREKNAIIRRQNEALKGKLQEMLGILRASQGLSVPSRPVQRKKVAKKGEDILFNPFQTIRRSKGDKSTDDETDDDADQDGMVVDKGKQKEDDVEEGSTEGDTEGESTEIDTAPSSSESNSTGVFEMDESISDTPFPGIRLHTQHEGLSFDNIRKPSRKVTFENLRTPETSYKEEDYDMEQINSCQLFLLEWLAKRRNAFNHNERKQTLGKILKEESTYIQELETCVSNFLEPLREEAQNSKIFSLEDHETLFCNMEIILNLSKEFLRGLQVEYAQFATSRPVGDYFVKMAPVMKLYGSYFKNYGASCSTLNRLQRDESFHSLLERVQAKGGSTWPLSDYLARPINRLPEYPEALRRMANCTPLNHPDRVRFDEALSKVGTIIQIINDKKKEEDNRRKIQEIEASLLGYRKKLFSPNLVFIREGAWLLIISVKKKSGERCYVFLFNDCIIVTKKTKSGMFRFQEQIDLREVSVNFLEEPGGGEKKMPGFFHNALYIKMKKGCRTFVLGKTKAHRESWRRTIEKLQATPKIKQNRKIISSTKATATSPNGSLKRGQRLERSHSWTVSSPSLKRRASKIFGRGSNLKNSTNSPSKD